MNQKGPKSNDQFSANPDKAGQQDISGKPPRTIQDTKAWKETQRGIKSQWTNYVELLKTSFRNMPRDAQEELISNFCVIMTLGVTALVIMFFYNFMPLLVRVLAVPLAFVSAWFAAKRIIVPVVIDRLEALLNQDYAP